MLNSTLMKIMTTKKMEW